MHFAEPSYLWVLAGVLPLLVVFLVITWRRRQQLITRFIQTRLLSQLTVGLSRTRQKARLALVAGGVALALFSLARPQWGFGYQEVHQRGLDIIIAIDTSRSMLAEDITPNRLARTKLAALDLRRIAEADRIGLVAFAGAAFLQMPMTTDENAFRQHLEALDVNLLPQGGTAITEAVRATQAAFKDAGLDNHRALVLFTDGEDHDGEAIEAVRQASKEGLTVFTIGVGTTDGQLLPVRDAKGRLDYVKDASGNAVKSRLNEDLLRTLAQAGGGFYLPLQGVKVMETLYERGLAPLPKRDTQSKVTRTYFERYQIFLGLALLLVLVEMLLPDRLRPKAGRNPSGPPAPAVGSAGYPKVAGWILAAVLVLGSARSMASPSGARREFESGRYKAALAEYERLLEKQPEDPSLHYNAGSAAYQAGKFDSAVDHFGAALATTDATLQQRGYYNRGNARFRAGEEQSEPGKRMEAWKQALEDYDTALKLNPSDTEALHNRDWVQKKLEELQQQQQQDPNKGDKDKKDNQDKKDGKDQQKNDDKNQDGDKGDKSSDKQDSKDGKDSKPEGADKQDPQKDSKSDDKSQSGDPSGQKKDEEGAQDKPQPKDGDKGKGGEDSQKGQSPKDERDTKPPKEPGQAGSPQGGQPGDPGAETGAPQGPRTFRMTQKEALQLLEALRSEERMMRPPMTLTNRPSRPVKDW